MLNLCHRIVSLVLICSLLLVTTGCWSGNEINNLAIINALGIDRLGSGEYQITAVVVNPSGQESSGGAMGEQLGNYIVTSKAASILEALKQIDVALSRKLYWAHMQVIIIGKSVAKHGIQPVLDALSRENDFRRNTDILMTDKKVDKLLETKAAFERSPGAEIESITNQTELVSMGMVNDLNQFLNEYYSEGIDPSVSGLWLSNDRRLKIYDQVMQQRAVIYAVFGTGVFNKDKFVGWLTQKETDGMLMVKGKMNQNILSIPCPDKKGVVNIAVTRLVSDKRPVFVHGHPEIYLKITVSANIEEITCMGLNVNPKQIQLLNLKADKIARKEIESAITKTKKMGSDVMGFGQAFYRKYPYVWKKMKQNWRSEGLKDLPVHVQVRVNIQNNGITNSHSAKGR